MSKERNIAKENAILTGIIAAPFAALVGGPAAALISIGAGVLVGNKKVEECKRKRAKIMRELAEQSAKRQAEEKEDRERVEEYPAEKFERRFRGSKDIWEVSNKLYNYFKDKVDVFDKDIHIFMSLYRPQYYWQENKCQKGTITGLYSFNEIYETNCINLNSDNFIRQYELYSLAENVQIKLYMYNTISCGYALIMKITLQNGEVKKFSCLPHWGLKPPEKVYYGTIAKGW